MKECILTRILFEDTVCQFFLSSLFTCTKKENGNNLDSMH